MISLGPFVEQLATAAVLRRRRARLWVLAQTMSGPAAFCPLPKLGGWGFRTLMAARLAASATPPHIASSSHGTSVAEGFNWLCWLG
jgi:hypothetical protein